jgi:hypothetical protein
MKDILFERSLTAMTFAIAVVMVAGLVFGWLGAFWMIFVALLVEIAGGGALVYFWGKDYMGRA